MTEGSSRHRRIRLVAAPPGAVPGGLEEAFVDAVREFKREDALRPLTVLAGSNPLRIHLSRLLAIRLGGHANIGFLLLQDLAREMGTPALAGRGRRRLPELGRDLLLREAVRPWAHGTYFQRIAGREGFLEAIAATLRDLKQAEIEPAVLRATAAAIRPRDGREKEGSGAELLAGKLEDLASLYEAYDDLVQDRRFYDDEDLMKAAARSAASAERGAMPAALVYGFYDLNGLQRSLLKEWLAFREGVVFFPFEDSAAREQEWAFAARLLAWMETWIPQRTKLAPPREAMPPAAVETRYFSVPGEAREAVEAVRWLVRIGRERSLPFGNLALLYRNADPYLRLLPEIFERAGGIPWHAADGLPLAASQAARALLLLLEAGERGLERRPVIDAMVVAGEPRASEWDRLSREAGVTAGAAAWSERLGRLAGEPAAALAARVDELSAALAGLPPRGAWREFASATLDLVERFVAEEIPRETLVERILGLAALDEIDTPVTRERYILVLARALDSWSDGDRERGHFQRSGIFVGSVMEARLLSFHAVAVVGMVEKGFPAPPRQDPVLLDEERERINSIVGGDRLPLKAARHREERLLFRLARATAGEALGLFYPRLDAAAARPRTPSPFLLDLETELSGAPTGFAALESSPRMERLRLAAIAPDTPSDALYPREFDLAAVQAAARGGDDPAAGRRVASFLHANPMLHRALQAVEARWEASRFTAHDGVVMKASLLDDLARIHPIRGMPVSISAVQQYATCPLQYLFGRVLRLQLLPDPESGEGLDPLRRGTLIHSILERLYTGLKERGWLPVDPDGLVRALRLMREAAAACFGEEERQAPVGYPLLWEMEKRGIVRDLETSLKKEAESGESWRPAYFEMSFGPGGGAGESAAAVSIEVRPGHSVMLRGRVDRIDLSADGSALRVTDYKSGVVSSKEGQRLRGGTTIQLPVYLIAAERILAADHPGIRGAEARYLSVSRKGKFAAVAYDAGALPEDRQALGRILGTTLREIERGHFFAYPGEACDRCDFQLACGEGREARFARKRDDRIASEFLEMREKIP